MGSVRWYTPAQTVPYHRSCPGMTYSHLTEAERNHIYEMKVEGLSVAASLRPSGGTI